MLRQLLLEILNFAFQHLYIGIIAVLFEFLPGPGLQLPNSLSLGQGSLRVDFVSKIDVTPIDALLLLRIGAVAMVLVLLNMHGRYPKNSREQMVKVDIGVYLLDAEADSLLDHNVYR